jgi:uncharacterized protein DUF6894
MPRYYFDFTDGGEGLRDSEGTVLADLEHARAEALEALAQIAKDELPDGDRREFKIAIRSEVGQLLLTASLFLRVDRQLG